MVLAVASDCLLLWRLLGSLLVYFSAKIPQINGVTKPIVFIPLPLGYLNGLASGIIHPKIALAAGQFFVVLACITSLHLLLYRYLCVSNSRVKFPLWSKLLLGYNYLIPIVNFLSTATADSETERVLVEWRQVSQRTSLACFWYQLDVSLPLLWILRPDFCKAGADPWHRNKKFPWNFLRRTPLMWWTLFKSYSGPATKDCEIQRFLSRNPENFELIYLAYFSSFSLFLFFYYT